MSSIFLNVLNLTINASYLILAVIVVRLILKKAPKWIHCLLWGLVAVRLICPFSLKSALSLLPSEKTVPENIEMTQVPQIDSGVRIIDNAVNPVIGSTFSPTVADSVNPMQVIVYIAGVIWIAGMLAMLIYAIISYILLKRKVRVSVDITDRVKECDEVKSPFILGLIRPVIYVPSGLDIETLELVTAHELAHLKRLDHWWKPLGFILLSVYWFNPLCWIAYILLCRDIEAACDERVIGDKDKEYIALYSQALLDLSVSRFSIAACPVAFGEVGVKKRVREILNYKKPAFWVILVAIIACIIVAICFMTNPKNSDTENNNTEAADLQNNAEVEDTDAIPEEWENCGVDYYFDGTNYVVDGDMVFQYKKKLVGRTHAARYDTMYIVLTNNPDITYEEVARSIYGSGAEDRLTDTIIIGMHVLDDNGNILSSNPNYEQELVCIDAWMDIKLPEGNETGILEDAIGYGYGFLIMPEVIHSLNSDSPFEYLFAGLITRVPSNYGFAHIEFDSDHKPKMQGVPIDNHTAEEYLRVLEIGNDGWYAIMLREKHELYTDEMVEARKQQGLASFDYPQEVEYWYFWYVKEDADYYYCIRLNAEVFSEAEAESIAKSVRIKE